MRAVICDQCKNRLESPEHWQAEQIGDAREFGHNVGPFD